MALAKPLFKSFFILLASEGSQKTEFEFLVTPCDSIKGDDGAAPCRPPIWSQFAPEFDRNLWCSRRICVLLVLIRKKGQKGGWSFRHRQDSMPTTMEGWHLSWAYEVFGVRSFGSVPLLWERPIKLDVMVRFSILREGVSSIEGCIFCLISIRFNSSICGSTDRSILWQELS